MEVLIVSIFSDRVKELRKKSGKKQVDIAAYVGVNPRIFRHYEAAQLEPNIERINKIADYFEVSVDYLFGRTDNPKPYS